MDLNMNTLMLSLLFGSIGMGLFIYGKKQGQVIHLASGLLLMVVPYFIPNWVLLTFVGALLTAAPFLL